MVIKNWWPKNVGWDELKVGTDYCYQEQGLKVNVKIIGYRPMGNVLGLTLKVVKFIGGFSKKEVGDTFRIRCNREFKAYCPGEFWELCPEPLKFKVQLEDGSWHMASINEIEWIEPRYIFKSGESVAYIREIQPISRSNNSKNGVFLYE